MSDMVAVRLELIAAKAKQLAQDVKDARLWCGELSKGLAEIRQQLNLAEDESRTDR